MQPPPVAPRSLHARVERGFEAWGAGVHRHRWAVLVASSALAAVLIALAPGLRTDNSVEGNLVDGDPARRVYDAFQRQYEQDQMLVVLVEPRELLSIPYLERLRALHEDLEASTPHVDEITSLVNVRHTRGTADTLVVEGLLERFPRTPADLETLRARLRSTPSYIDAIVDRDLEATAIIVKPRLYSDVAAADALAGFDADPGAAAEPALLTDAETHELVDAVRAVLDRHRAPDLALHLAGGPVIDVVFTEVLMSDVQRVMLSALVVNAGILLLLFRRASGVALPLLVVMLALGSTLGIMALLDIPTSVAGQVLPVLLLVVGVCDAVHLLVIVYRRLDAGDDRRDALVSALGHSGLAILMTSLTTAGGMISFATAELAIIRNLGISASIGILVAFAFSVTLLPALIAVLPLRPRPLPPGDRLRPVDRVLSATGAFAGAHAGAVLAGAALAIALSLVGASRLEFSQYGLRWFPPGDPMRAATERVDAVFRGSTSLEILLDTGEPRGLHDPATLRRIDRAAAFASTFRSGPVNPGKALSVVDIVKETHRALHEDDPAAYAIPSDRELLAQELLLFESSGSDDLEELVDAELRFARLSVRVPFVDGMYYPRFLAELERGLEPILGPDIGVEFTGISVLLARAWSVLNLSMARSYTLALLVITPLMILLVGRVRRGLLAMVPNLMPVVLTLGLMGWVGFPLDNSSLLVGCVIIGLAVDDTIHFMHKFQRYHEDLGDVDAAIRETLVTTGSALLFTTLVLAAGFLMMTRAYMLNAVEFGIIAACAAVFAFLADVLVAPALLSVAARRRVRGSPG